MYEKCFTNKVRLDLISMQAINEPKKLDLNRCIINNKPVIMFWVFFSLADHENLWEWKESSGSHMIIIIIRVTFNSSRPRLPSRSEMIQLKQKRNSRPEWLITLINIFVEMFCVCFRVCISLSHWCLGVKCNSSPSSLTSVGRMDKPKKSQTHFGTSEKHPLVMSHCRWWFEHSCNFWKLKLTFSSSPRRLPLSPSNLVLCILFCFMPSHQNRQYK